MSAEYVAINRERWDERVPLHLASAFYDVKGFLAGASSLRDFELDELGDVDGMTLIHPQCHFGQDTISWARRGARVTGLDFSAPAIDAARELSERAGIGATWIQADVYDAVEAGEGVRHDVVYTGLGALNWLPDVERWARVMAGLLAPGGRFYLAEFHPFAGVFGDRDLTVTYPYFQTEPQRFEDVGSYADLEAPTVHNRSIEWNHPIGSVVSAVDRGRPATRVPARARSHAVPGLALPRGRGTGDPSTARRRSFAAADVLVASRRAG